MFAYIQTQHSMCTAITGISLFEILGGPLRVSASYPSFQVCIRQLSNASCVSAFQLLPLYSRLKQRLKNADMDVQNRRAWEIGEHEIDAASAFINVFFACHVQRCDPAPFYLFDEIDAALDPQV